MEFSNPNKHRILSKGILKGPIGTNKNNSFILKFKRPLKYNFNSFLDEQRIKPKGDFIIYENQIY